MDSIHQEGGIMSTTTKNQQAARTRMRSGRTRSGTRPMARVDVPRHIKDIVERAAAIQGRTDTDFLISALSEAANKVIADDSVIRLCLADQEVVATALFDGKPHPAPRKLARLRRAVREHSQSVESI
jgi:uncharacterized protein (DUF1778 family)